MPTASPTDRAPDVGVLIPAAGSGERAGGGEPKQFRLVGGVPMLLRAVRPFARHPRVRHIVVALPGPVAAAPPAWLGDIQGERLSIVPGGETRLESVRSALGALDGACSVVLVHDAARPFVSDATIDAVIDAATDMGAVPAVPVSDTLKRAHAKTLMVQETVPRAGLWRAQTPQGCPRSMLEEAYRRLGQGDAAALTDEAALLEAAGFPVQLVPDEPSNLKITTPYDLALADAIVAAR